MFTKPHYRQALVSSIKVGDVVYSSLCGEAYPVERIKRGLNRTTLYMGILELSGFHDRPVWVQTKARELK